MSNSVSLSNDVNWGFVEMSKDQLIDSAESLQDENKRLRKEMASAADMLRGHIMTENVKGKEVPAIIHRVRNHLPKARNDHD